MSAARPIDPLAKQLEVYEESWKAEHEEVKRTLWRFEDQLAVGLALFKAIHDRYWTWRERVCRGVRAYDPEEEQEIKGRFAGWLRPCEEVERVLILLEAQYGPIEGAPQFRRFFQEASQILEKWTRPEPAPAPTRVSSHTDQATTMGQMAEALDRVSRPADEDSVPLRHPTDYNKAF
jgi:hypothetical protein